LTKPQLQSSGRLTAGSRCRRETGCVFHGALGFPDPLEAGLRLERLGRTSITYGIGLFRPGAIEEAATARFVHVCVDRGSRQPVEVPGALRLALAALA
jgi:acyl-CoA thioester hydrolase